MALRSQTVQIKIVRCRRTDHPTHRITGTIRGRQRCAFRADAGEAQALADAWETERVNNHAAIRARATQLNQAQISEAEAIFKLCENLGAAPMNVILAGVHHAPLGNTRKKPSEAVAEFLGEKKETFSPGQLENYRLISERFAKFSGETATLDEITTERVTEWLKSLGQIKKKTWNSYRNDLSALFAWCVARPRQWIKKTPSSWSCVTRKSRS